MTNATRVSVEEGYGLWAPSYDGELNPLLALEQRQVEPMLPDLGGKRVLDVACGTGRWLERLLRGGARAGVGVDLSSAMLDSARGKRGLRDRLVRADGLRLPFASGIADLAICSFALAHLRELEPLVRELARVAGPQADLFVTDVHPRGYARGWQTAFFVDGRTVGISTFPHPVEEVRESFETHGFELLQLTEARLGEPEWPIFLQAGKAGHFKEACEAPAVLICQFRRKSSGGSGEHS